MPRSKEKNKQIRMVKNQEYPTYQIRVDVLPSNSKKGMSVHHTFNKCLLYVLNWLKDRIEVCEEEIKTESEKRLAHFLDSIPLVTDYKSFEIDSLVDEGNYKNIIEYNFKMLYVEMNDSDKGEDGSKCWALRIKERDNRRDFIDDVESDIFNREFVTDVAIKEMDSYVSVATKTTVREPVTNYDCNVVRTEFIDDIFDDKDLIKYENYKKCLERITDVHLYEVGKLTTECIDLTFNQVIWFGDFFLNYYENKIEQQSYTCNMPTIIFVGDRYARIKNEVAKAVYGYARVLYISGKALDKFINWMKRKDDIKKYSEDNNLLNLEMDETIYELDEYYDLHILGGNIEPDDVCKESLISRYTSYTRKKTYDFRDIYFYKDLKIKKYESFSQESLSEDLDECKIVINQLEADLQIANKKIEKAKKTADRYEEEKKEIEEIRKLKKEYGSLYGIKQKLKKNKINNEEQTIELEETHDSIFDDKFAQAPSYKSIVDGTREQIRHFPKEQSDIVYMFLALYPDRIAFTERGLKSLKTCKTKPSVLWEVLSCMVTSLYDSFVVSQNYGEAIYRFNNESIFQVARGNGSQTNNNKKIARLYRDIYCGKEINIEMHLKSRENDSNDDKFIRIYFDNVTMDNGKPLLVVGHCGSHLKTEGSRRNKQN